MDTESAASLLSILTCLLPFCLGLLGLAAAAGLLFWFIRRQRRPKGEADLAAERQAAGGHLAQQAAGLRPWSPDALADLSTDWDARWSKFGRDLSARGTIPSLSEPKGQAWVSFVLKVRGARQPTGQLLARTTAQAFTYALSAQGVAIEVDGAPWGSLLPDGTLLDAAGAPAGSAPRPGGGPAMFRLGSVSHLRDKRPRSYPVTLAGRPIGHLANPPAQMLNTISLTKREFAPAVEPAGDLGQEEATWLLALAILQVAGYNVLETIWTH
jgi:hypothetical protein